jgi:hypothetical protein
MFNGHCSNVGFIFETKDIYWLLEGLYIHFGGDYGCVR